MNKLIDYAKTELQQIGYEPAETLKDDDANKWMQNNILELLSVFSKQKHSGFSANYIIQCFSKLALFNPLSPITGISDEWIKYKDNKYQNKRLTSIFKDGINGTPYYLNAIIWKEQLNNGTFVLFTGNIKFDNGQDISSIQNIEFPFIPKSFYINVKLIDNNTYKLINPVQLDEAAEYYNLIINS